MYSQGKYRPNLPGVFGHTVEPLAQNQRWTSRGNDTSLAGRTGTRREEEMREVSE